MKRLSLDEYFMGVTNVVKQRSTCFHRQVGAVLVKDKRILATGYNGAPAKILNCCDGGACRKEGGKACMATHAEMNAIVSAAFMGSSINGSVLYTNFHPCFECAKVIINSGIQEIVYEEDYREDGARELLAEAKVRVRKLLVKIEPDDENKTEFFIKTVAIPSKEGNPFNAFSFVVDFAQICSDLDQLKLQPGIDPLPIKIKIKMPEMKLFGHQIIWE
jgi:dCMP deaminase